MDVNEIAQVAAAATPAVRFAAGLAIDRLKGAPSMRTTLESGAWIEHVPIQDLKGKHKRAMDRAGKPKAVFDASGEVDKEATLSGLDVMAFSAARRDAVWAMVVTGWSYDLPVPVLGDGGQVDGAEAYGELPLEDFEELEALLEPFEAKLSRRPDPKGSRSATTSASNGSSRANAGPASRKG